MLIKNTLKERQPFRLEVQNSLPGRAWSVFLPLAKLKELHLLVGFLREGWWNAISWLPANATHAHICLDEDDGCFF